jgi:hypothetical protein
MEDIKYFWEKALYSARKGVFHPRSWKQLIIIILLDFKCLYLFISMVCSVFVIINWLLN